MNTWLTKSQMEMRAAEDVTDTLRQNGIRLGRIQRGVLCALLENGPYPGRWTWGTESETLRVLQSLARRNLVVDKTVRSKLTNLTKEFDQPYYLPAPEVVSMYRKAQEKYGYNTATGKYCNPFAKVFCDTWNANQHI